MISHERQNNSDRPKNAALIYADLERGTIHRRCRLADDLAGRPVLRRTVQRLEKAELLDEVIVLCPADQQGSLQELLAGTAVLVHGLNEPVPVSPYVVRRKWSLACWRGGIHEATVFDEQSFTSEMVDLARSRDIHSVVAVPPEAVLIDGRLLDDMISYHHAYCRDMRFTITPAAPGLLACVYRLDMLHELVLTGLRLGDVLCYDPDHPHSDFLIERCTFKVEPALSDCVFRFLADTARSWVVFEKMLQSAGDTADDWGACEIVEAMDRCRDAVDILPAELEVEINTDTSLRVGGYPHRNGNGLRGPMSCEQFAKIVGDCADYDDICLTLGGLGEPLAHPDLIAMVETARQAGMFAVNIETDGRALAGDLAQSLLEAPIDVISVYLDAHQAEFYEQNKGENNFEQLKEQLEWFIEQGRSAGLAGPLVVPHLVKTTETMDQMEEFYDYWLRRCGTAVIVGFSDFAGQIDDQAVMTMAPPRRLPCRHLDRCLTILSDGRATVCCQDYQGLHTIGSVQDAAVSQLWRSPPLEQLRTAQQRGVFDGHSLCSCCHDWHR